VPTPQKTDEKIILVLQGGGALGAYQAGAYEALAAADWAPEWVSGISIGAINAAIIAGNRPEERVEKLHAFWNLVSGDLLAPLWSTAANARLLSNEASSAFALLCGIPGFFSPRFPPTYLAPQAPLEELSYYTTESLRETLLTLVDFDLINSGEVRLSVGAVDVATGNFCYFDNHKMEIIPEHIMASGALPPGFAPVRIGEDYFWDGGLVSNTPLQYVLDYNEHDRDICVFQVDLFSARGDVPLTMLDVEQRINDNRF
jgi:NTE family protein